MSFLQYASQVLWFVSDINLFGAVTFCFGILARSTVRDILKPVSQYARLTNNLGVSRRRFNRMKFALIVLPSCFDPTAWLLGRLFKLNFSATMKTCPQLPDGIWHVRLPLITSDYYSWPEACSPPGRFDIQFFIQPSDPLNPLGNGMPALQIFAIEACSMVRSNVNYRPLFVEKHVTDLWRILSILNSTINI